MKKIRLTSSVLGTGWHSVIPLTFILIAITAVSISGQNPALELVGEAQGQATIHLTHIATLGESEGPGEILGISTIAKLGNGGYALSDNGDSYLIKVYSEKGEFIRAVGGRGQGPGEFGYIRYLLSYGDNLHVVDIATPRITTFSSGFDVLQIVPHQIRSSYDCEVISDSLMVFNATLRHPDRIDYPLHLVDNGGNIVRSIAEEAGGHESEALGRIYYRKVARSSSGGIWTLRRTKYQLEEWSVSGRLLNSISRRVDWFPEYPENRGGTMRDDQRRRLPGNLWPTSRDVREDDDGLLWVVISVYDSDWPEYVSVYGSGEEERVEVHDPQRAYDTIIEVIDYRAGILLATERFDESLYNFIGSDEIISSTREEDGSNLVHVWRLSLSHPTHHDY